MNCFYSILDSSSSRNKSLLSEPRETLSSLFCSIQLLPFLHEHQWVIKPICPMWPLEPSLPGLVHTFLQVSSVRNMWSISCLVVLLASGGGGGTGTKECKNLALVSRGFHSFFPCGLSSSVTPGPCAGATYGNMDLIWLHLTKRDSQMLLCIFYWGPFSFLPSVQMASPPPLGSHTHESLTWGSTNLAQVSLTPVSD